MPSLHPSGHIAQNSAFREYLLSVDKISGYRGDCKERGEIGRKEVIPL